MGAPHCRAETHERRPGARTCLTCQRARQRARRRRGQVLLVRGGDSVMAAAARKAWATKRERYGPTGVAPAVAEASRRRLHERHATMGHYLSRRTHCKNGHPFSPANTALERSGNRQRRRCRACLAIIRRGRPDWVVVGGARISLKAHDAFVLREHARLRGEMVAAHPDKGGTSAKFIKARRQIVRFLETETQWYRQHGASVPDISRRSVNMKTKTVIAALFVLALSLVPAAAQTPVTGGERLAWDMTTGTSGANLTLAEAQALSYFPLVDVADLPVQPTPVPFTGVTCTGTPGAVTCSAPLMALTPGPHTLRIVARPTGGMPSLPSLPLSVIVIVRVAAPTKLQLLPPASSTGAIK